MASRSARWKAILLAVGLAAGPSFGQVGDVSFATSAGTEAQAHFLKGVAILHSFGFEDAVDEFRKAQEIEPDFALAYWGEAMANNNNPLVAPTRQDLPAARRALQKLALGRTARIDKAKTDREKGFMEAVELLYGEGPKHERDLAYASRMAALSDAYPEDEEVAAFYSLALLGTVRRAGDDFHVQMQAAAIAQDLYRTNPDHPGAAHYIIHAFDDPDHAVLALHAAKRYASIAPDVEHALHMPSHIFVQLGMWEEVASSNRRAYDASAEWAERRGLSPARRDFHALAWWQYANLQLGRADEARKAFEELGDIVAARETTTRIRATLANMKARYLLETDDWDDEMMDVDRLLTERSAGDVFLLLAAGRRAAGEGKLSRTRTIVERLEALAEMDTVPLKSYLQGQVTLDDLKVSAAVAHVEVEALLFLAEGNGDEAMRRIESAVAKEHEMHPAYGPPEPMKPPLELLGEIASALGDHERAVKAFESMVERMPNRTQSMMGAATAAMELGQPELVRAHLKNLRRIWGDGNVRLRGLEEYLRSSDVSE